MSLAQKKRPVASEEAVMSPYILGNLYLSRYITQ